MSYSYIKKPLSPQPSSRFKFQPKTKKRFASLLFGAGSLLFASAIFPILNYQLGYSTQFGQLKNPLSTRFYNRSDNILGTVDADYTQLSNWFIKTTADQSKILNSQGEQTYLFTIPKLKIADVTVTVGSMDLKKSLIQYPNTALPGQLGNTVVFGHSVLPQFFNPKSYLTIFSTLFKLTQGDEILLKYDQIQYRYLVEEMYEVTPADLSVLEQRFDGRYLTLITCSPPGTYLRRLIIRARIVDF